jgi:hypothetical protein
VKLSHTLIAVLQAAALAGEHRAKNLPSENRALGPDGSSSELAEEEREKALRIQRQLLKLGLCRSNSHMAQLSLSLSLLFVLSLSS